MNLDILPLAITMMAGPQIISALIFVTTVKPVKVSAAWVLGVAIATAVGISIATGLGHLLGDRVDLGKDAEVSSTGHIIQLALVGLLIVLAVKSYLSRETAKPPKFLGTLMAADPRRALKTGLLLVLVMPSDVIIMLTVGANLAQNDLSLVAALPFIGLTVLIAALPLLSFLLFRNRAEHAMPKVRDWVGAKSWVVNIIMCLVFILLILS